MLQGVTVLLEEGASQKRLPGGEGFLSPAVGTGHSAEERQPQKILNPGENGSQNQTGVRMA